MILIYGGTGWLGRQLAEILKYQEEPYHISSVRIENLQDIKTELDTV